MNYHIITCCSECSLTVACDGLSQRCQWLSPVMQTKSTKVHFKTQELFLAFVAASDETPALPLNLIMQWIEVLSLR